MSCRLSGVLSTTANACRASTTWKPVDPREGGTQLTQGQRLEAIRCPGGSGASDAPVRHPWEDDPRDNRTHPGSVHGGPTEEFVRDDIDAERIRRTNSQWHKSAVVWGGRRPACHAWERWVASAARRSTRQSEGATFTVSASVWLRPTPVDAG